MTRTAAPARVALDVLSFVAGLSGAFVIRGIGELYGSEVALPILALFSLLLRGRREIRLTTTAYVLLSASVSMLFGYVVADLVAHTNPANYLRGWARVVAVLSSYASLLIVLCRSRQALQWFVAGAALAEAGRWLAIGAGPTDLVAWKLGYGDALVTLAASAGPLVSMAMTCLSMTALGVYSVMHDSRSLGVIAIMAAAATWLIARRQRSDNAALFVRGAVLCIVVAPLLVVATQVSTRDYARRQSVSDTGRFAALRLGVKAVLDNPIVGYGSWGQGTETYAAEFFEETRADLLEQGEQAVELGNTFGAHSQILHAWMEGGILAGSFFVCYIVVLLRSLLMLLVDRPYDRLTAAATWLLLIALWHAFMSPFNGSHRITIATVMALAALLASERASGPQAAQVPAESLRRGHPAPHARLNSVRFPNLVDAGRGPVVGADEPLPRSDDARRRWVES